MPGSRVGRGPGIFFQATAGNKPATGQETSARTGTRQGKCLKKQVKRLKNMKKPLAEPATTGDNKPHLSTTQPEKTK